MYRWYNEDKERCEEPVEVISVSQALSYFIRFLWNETFKREGRD